MVDRGLPGHLVLGLKWKHYISCASFSDASGTQNLQFLSLFWILTGRCALDERISLVLVEAPTHRIVIDNGALSRQPTSAEARIDAPLIAASSVPRAIGAENALWSAGRRRSLEPCDATADCLAIGGTAVAVGTAGRRTAGVGDLHICKVTDFRTIL